MSKSGKWLLIFGIIAIVSAIAFGCTVAACGVRDNDYGITIGGEKLNFITLGGLGMGKSGIRFRDNMTNYDFEFDSFSEYSHSMDASSLTELSIELASCKAEIICEDTDRTSIKYVTGSAKTYFSAEMNENKLTISEKPATVFNFGSTKSSTLTLTVPKKVYDSIKLELASGKIASSEIICDKLSAEVASGRLELGAYAKDIRLDLASGKMIINNCTEDAAENIKVNTASGGVEMNGFRSADTKVDLASGSVVLTGISGRADVDIASGHVELSFAEWNDDLDISLASGKADIKLPAGSGADTRFKRASGGMTIDLDGQNATLKGGSDMTIGGSNVHKVNAEVLSGNITIHN